MVFLTGAVILLLYTVSLFLKDSASTWLGRIVTGGLAAALMLIGGIMKGSLISIGIGAAVWIVLSLLLRFFAGRTPWENASRFLVFLSKAAAVVLVLEVAVFNFNSYHLLKGGYEETELDPGDAVLENVVFDGDGYVTAGTSASLEFLSVGRKVGTIVLDVEPDSYKADYSIDFADETNANYYIRQGLVKGAVFREIEATKTVVCDFSGDVSKLKINFTDISEGTGVKIRSVALNRDYPSECSYLRMLIFLFGAAFVWIFRHSLRFSEGIGTDLSRAKTVTALIVIVFVLTAMCLSGVNIHLDSDFQLTTGNQMTKELVDAFEQGQVELTAQASPELLAMDNPYDWSERALNNVNALWDHVFFNGNYYSYYGIGPVALLFLPYHLLTGFYFPSGVAVMLFTCLGLVFLGMTFFALMKRLFPDVPLSVYTVSLVTILASSGAMYCTVIANFYEIAQSSGFCFTALGAYFLVTSGVFGEGGLKRIRALLSSLFLALAVTCRPTTAIWCVVALVFIAFGVMKLHKNGEKKGILTYLLATLVPFAVIGGVQMLYNHARFGSFTDFGIQYSLTINDFTHTEFHTQLAAIGFFDYLFAGPRFSGAFPYIETNLSTLGVNGYYFVATENGVGLFFRALPMFALFAAPFALKYVKPENRVKAAVLFTAAGVAAPCIIIASVWESGYGVRYMMDFAWQMVTCAFFVIYVFYRERKGADAKRIYEHLLLIAMFLSLAVNFAMTYSFFYPGPYVAGHEAAFESLARMFTVFP